MRSPDVQIADHSPHSRNSDPNSIQAFPFPHLHEDPEPDSSCHEELQEGQLAGLPPLDWLSENPTSADIGDRPGILASAARQPGAALVEPSIGDPAELLSQPNAPFLLNFLNSREDDSRQGPKDSAPGRRKTIWGICGLCCLCYLTSICGLTPAYNITLLQLQVGPVRIE